MNEQIKDVAQRLLDQIDNTSHVSEDPASIANALYALKKLDILQRVEELVTGAVAGEGGLLDNIDEINKVLASLGSLS